MKHLLLALLAAASLVAASPSPAPLNLATAEPLHASRGFDITVETDTTSANGSFHCTFADPVWVCARK